MIARQTLNIYIQYLKNLPRLRGYSLVLYIGLPTFSRSIVNVVGRHGLIRQLIYRLNADTPTCMYT